MPDMVVEFYGEMLLFKPQSEKLVLWMLNRTKGGVEFDGGITVLTRSAKPIIDALNADGFDVHLTKGELE